VILPKDRHPRFITIRRGGTLTESDHRLLALWAATCAEHVLHLFESAQPLDSRPRQAIAQARAWVRGEVTMSQAREAAGMANAAARELSGAARHAAYAAGQPRPWRTSLRTSSERRPTRSRRRVQPLLKARLRTPGGASADGSAKQSQPAELGRADAMMVPISRVIDQPQPKPGKPGDVRQQQ
jgi:hypothetical protein